MTVEPLPLPDDPRLAELVASWTGAVEQADAPYLRWATRSAWLREYEMVLREHYPTAPRKRLNLTARLAAPFPLALPGVP